MKTTLSVYDFRDAFIRAGRKDQFSYDALGLIYDYLEEIDSDYDLDVIGLCCELSEESPQEIARNYAIDLEDDGNELLNVLDYLHDHTTVIGTTSAGSIVYVQF
jgi:hypothetical protein